MADSRIIAPPGYPARVRLCLDALPGAPHQVAALLGIDPSVLSRWRAGTRAPEAPGALARACGIEESLLVHGPTERLRVVLAGLAARAS